MKKLSPKRKLLLLLAGFFIGFQLLVGFNFWLGSKYLCRQDQFAYSGHAFGEIIQKPACFWSRANFDGIHYLEIAQKGYGLYEQAFFPLYPLLIRYLGRFLDNQYLLAGWLISSLSLAASLWLFYRLVLLDYPEKIAQKSLLNLLIFPTSFFLVAVYNESLFLGLTLLSFYLVRRRRYYLAPIAASLAVATRLVGIFIIPALIWELWQEQKKVKLNFSLLIKSVWVILVSVLGIAFYLNFLNQNYHDPLMFLSVQPHFGAGREVGRIVLLYQVFWRYLKMIITCQKDSLLFLVVCLELVSAIMFLVLLIFAYFKNIRRSYLIFAAGAFITPTLTGTFSSLPRYVLVLFPCLMVLSLLQEEHPYLSKLYLIIMLGLLFASQILFSQGYWIS